MWYRPLFKDRRDAGRTLAAELGRFEGRSDVVVLALPRGGVPVAAEVADALGAPLDVFVVRKLGVPGQEELAFGALASGDVTVFNEGVVRALRMPDELRDMVIAREKRELDRREQLYRGGRPPLDVKDKVAIVVDDGLATGASMAAAVNALDRLGPARVVVAVPVAAAESCAELEQRTGAQCICAATPEPFYGVGMWYEDFAQVSDDEVIDTLRARWPNGRNARAHTN
jgi:predicted phosphoribosyltransferase